MKHIKAISFVIFLLCFLFPSALRAGAVPAELRYDRPAENWMTSFLPMGNGEFGIMFSGGIAEERIQFNEKTLWTGSPEIRGAYQNFGDLLISFPDEGEVSGYLRKLSLNEALGSVVYNVGDATFSREYFVSNPDDVAVFRFERSGGPVSLSLKLKGGRGEVSVVSEEDGTIGFGGKLDLVSYEALLKVCPDGGELHATDSTIDISGASSVTVFLSGMTDFDLLDPEYVSGTRDDLKKELYGRVFKASSEPYDVLKSRHIKDYSSLYGKVSLNLGNMNEVPEFTTDELLRNHTDNPYLDMLVFQYGRYLMISSSRGLPLPSNLQGLWNDSNTPPWECDIHSNINIQMNYWPAGPANLEECHFPFLEYVRTEALKSGGSWQKIASEDGCRGWTINTQNNIFGYSDWNINRPANAWYSMHFWSHYVYTGDKIYLRSSAWPVMKSACEYWFDRLKEDSDGTLVSPDDWSPEHGPWENGPAYAQQLVCELFDCTLKAADVLDISDSFTDSLKTIYSRTDRGLRVGEDGCLREWKYSYDQGDGKHRHLSHLIALYPGHGLEKSGEDIYMEAARKALDLRGDGGTGWSRAWKISCWARLRDGERAYSLLKSAQNWTDMTSLSMSDSDGGLYSNLLDAHPPFQIDGNFGICAGIAEMLLQNTGTCIVLLPALPAAWQDGSFSGLAAENGFRVSLEWKDGVPVSAEILSLFGERCSLMTGNAAVQSVLTAKGKKVRFVKDNGVISFDTEAGSRYRIKMY